MTSRDFCYWLQGFFEISGVTAKKPKALTKEQTRMIQAHLSMVFKHEIDPSMGDKKHQAVLDAEHDAGKKPVKPAKATPIGPHHCPGPTVYRC